MKPKRSHRGSIPAPGHIQRYTHRHILSGRKMIAFRYRINPYIYNLNANQWDSSVWLPEECGSFLYSSGGTCNVCTGGSQAEVKRLESTDKRTVNTCTRVGGCCERQGAEFRGLRDGLVEISSSIFLPVASWVWQERTDSASQVAEYRKNLWPKKNPLRIKNILLQLKDDGICMQFGFPMQW